MPIPAWIALSVVFVGACVRVCLANPLCQSLEWKADGDVREAFELLQLWDCAAEVHRCPTSSLQPRFPSPLPRYPALSHLSETLSLSLSLSITFLSYLPTFLALHCVYFLLLHTPFSFILRPPPPSRPKEIWFPPPLPGLFTMIPVCMADKDHIAVSIWRHLHRFLYTRSFTHLHTLNTAAITNMLCGRWVLMCVPAIHLDIRRQQCLINLLILHRLRCLPWG